MWSFTHSRTYPTSGGRPTGLPPLFFTTQLIALIGVLGASKKNFEQFLILLFFDKLLRKQKYFYNTYIDNQEYLNQQTPGFGF